MANIKDSKLANAIARAVLNEIINKLKINLEEKINSNQLLKELFKQRG